MRILIVEDEPMITKGISFLLRQYDFPGESSVEIFDSKDGRGADRLLKKYTFDIVFTDIKMPEMDGLELIDKWSKRAAVPLWVIISGYNDFDFVRKAMQNGVKDYLLKPVTKIKMKETLDRLMKIRKEKMEGVISISQFEEVLDQLEESLWTLDEKAVISTYREWTQQFSLKNQDTVILGHYLNELLSMLIQRLQDKGVKHLNEKITPFTGICKKELDKLFIDRCKKILELIKEKRKRNAIDPIMAAQIFIEENLGNKVNLEDVSEKLGFNPAYFSQLFKKETGESFVAFRRRLRMERAKQLLEKGEMRIIDISNEIGYEDLPHFTKSFKQYTGYTPSEYRKKLGVTV